MPFLTHVLSYPCFLADTADQYTVTSSADSAKHRDVQQAQVQQLQTDETSSQPGRALTPSSAHCVCWVWGGVPRCPTHGLADSATTVCSTLQATGAGHSEVHTLRPTKLPRPTGCCPKDLGCCPKQLQPQPCSPLTVAQHSANTVAECHDSCTMPVRCCCQHWIGCMAVQCDAAPQQYGPLAMQGDPTFETSTNKQSNIDKH
jgi:hypothetical protein